MFFVSYDFVFVRHFVCFCYCFVFWSPRPKVKLQDDSIDDDDDSPLAKHFIIQSKTSSYYITMAKTFFDNDNWQEQLKKRVCSKMGKACTNSDGETVTLNLPVKDGEPKDGEPQNHQPDANILWHHRVICVNDMHFVKIDRIAGESGNFLSRHGVCSDGNIKGLYAEVSAAVSEKKFSLKKGDEFLDQAGDGTFTTNNQPIELLEHAKVNVHTKDKVTHYNSQK